MNISEALCPNSKAKNSTTVFLTYDHIDIPIEDILIKLNRQLSTGKKGSPIEIFYGSKTNSEEGIVSTKIFIIFNRPVYLSSKKFIIFGRYPNIKASSSENRILLKEVITSENDFDYKDRLKERLGEHYWQYIKGNILSEKNYKILIAKKKPNKGGEDINKYKLSKKIKTESKEIIIIEDENEKIILEKEKIEVAFKKFKEDGQKLIDLMDKAIKNKQLLSINNDIESLQKISGTYKIKKEDPKKF
jgi:hypothetical protein